MSNYVVAFYEIDREYGGPEEGGWYYDSGRLVRVFAVTKSKGRAYRTAGRANEMLHRLQRHKPSAGSVLYSGGRHLARVYRDAAPSCYPNQTPWYE